MIRQVNVLQDQLSSLIRAAESLRIKGLAVPDELPGGESPAKSDKSDVNHTAKRRKKETKSEQTVDKPVRKEGGDEENGDKPEVISLKCYLKSNQRSSSLLRYGHCKEAATLLERA